MFALTEMTQSFEILDEFKDIEIELFRKLGLFIRLNI